MVQVAWQAEIDILCGQPHPQGGRMELLGGGDLLPLSAYLLPFEGVHLLKTRPPSSDYTVPLLPRPLYYWVPKGKKNG